ncbi:MAG: hypothetical protein DRJ03_13825 [Chloroflexi bacterium]|nr:MAG: hypothetical protein DRJ03_13825 [Chloroflexota bacterium]
MLVLAVVTLLAEEFAKSLVVMPLLTGMETRLVPYLTRMDPLADLPQLVEKIRTSHRAMDYRLPGGAAADGNGDVARAVGAMGRCLCH